MSHSNRKLKVAGRASLVQEKQPRVIKATSVQLQQILAQTRGILGLIGLGSLPLSNQELPLLEIHLKQTIQDMGCTYLVPAGVAASILEIARMEHPDSVMRTDLFTTVQVFGRSVKLVPIYVQDAKNL